MSRVLIWAVLALALTVPILLAAQSPLLQWRSPVYIIAGLAGVFALALLLVQPMLVAGWIPGLRSRLGRRVHAWVGSLLVLSIIIHVSALWITSPPDVIDALTFRSPTPFSDWGVIAMWAAFAAATLARFRGRVRPAKWRLGHTFLISITVAGSILHALLVEGTMESVSKVTLCVLVAIATLGAVHKLKAWNALRRR